MRDKAFEVSEDMIEGNTLMRLVVRALFDVPEIPSIDQGGKQDHQRKATYFKAMNSLIEGRGGKSCRD